MCNVNKLCDDSTDRWTDTKVALVELIYALHSSTSINNGAIELKTLAFHFENLFNIELTGDIYRIFLEIGSRKGTRTVYLNKLIDALNNRMDQTDNN